MINLKDFKEYKWGAKGRPPIKINYNGKEITLKEYAELNNIKYNIAYRLYKKNKKKDIK